MTSPFYISEEFISPAFCEKIRNELSLHQPNIENGQPLPYERFLTDSIKQTIDLNLSGEMLNIEKLFGASVISTSLSFQQHWENMAAPAMQIGLPGWKFSRRKWTKNSPAHLIGFIWLKDFNSAPPLDINFEVYGGKLEFPSFDFSLLPAQGSLILFPAVPNFAFGISHVMLGSLEQLCVHITFDNWEYQSDKFPGTYKDWFLTNESI